MTVREQIMGCLANGDKMTVREIIDTIRTAKAQDVTNEVKAMYAEGRLLKCTVGNKGKPGYEVRYKLTIQDGVE